MSAVVLDASALIAMLKGERGAAKVAGAIAGASIGAVSHAEVVGHFIAAGMPPEQVDAMLDPLPVTVVPVDRALARIAGQMCAITGVAGLRTGDRFCLALARRDGLSAWTADPGWKGPDRQGIAGAAGVKMVVIR